MSSGAGRSGWSTTLPLAVWARVFDTTRTADRMSASSAATKILSRLEERKVIARQRSGRARNVTVTLLRPNEVLSPEWLVWPSTFPSRPPSPCRGGFVITDCASMPVPGDDPVRKPHYAVPASGCDAVRCRTTWRCGTAVPSWSTNETDTGRAVVVWYSTVDGTGDGVCLSPHS